MRNINASARPKRDCCTACQSSGSFHPGDMSSNKTIVLCPAKHEFGINRPEWLFFVPEDILDLPFNLQWQEHHEEEIILPHKWDKKSVLFRVNHLLPFPSPLLVSHRLITWSKYATGRIDGYGMGGKWCPLLQK